MSDARRYAAYSPQMALPHPDEAALAEEMSEVLLRISQQTWEDSHHALRSVHAKSHGLLAATLEVLPGLPPELAQGLFAQPGRYEAVMRFSTTPGDLLPDRVSTPRGLALKFLDVPGERLEGSEAAHCQDLLMVNGPQFNAPNAKAFLRSLKLLAPTTDRAERTKQVLSALLRGTERALEAVGGQSAKLKAMGGEPPHHILGETFFTQLPLRYGAHVAKLQLVPVDPALLAHQDERIDLKQANALRDAVSAHFASQGGVWELRAQLSTDLERLPIDDATVVWDEEESPFRTVARLTASPQVGWSQDRARLVDDQMGFSPWHGVQDHRPLGDIMRIRKRAYQASQDFRARKSGCPLHDRSLSAGAQGESE
ncbi:catalase family protein [Pseudoxanthomonas winnipegensis]|nr:catalase family protein [Pseudoxanthomonas winnipegensis]